jgi:Caspase domain/Tetratricopeptide repeat
MRRTARLLAVFSILALVRPAHAALRDDCEQSKDLDLSISACSTLIKSTPNLAAAYIARGHAYLANGDLGKAISDAEQVIRLSPNSVTGFELRSKANFNKANLEAALSDANRLVELRPDAASFEFRGIVLQSLNKEREAVTDLQRALSLDTHLDTAEKLLRYIKRASQSKIAGSCSQQTMEARPTPKVTVKFSNEAVTVGSALQAEWSLVDWSADASRPAYFILLVPDSSRFEGMGFFALNSGANNPYGIQYGSERVRAIAPLHTNLSSPAGTIEILPGDAGEVEFEWAVVGVDACGEWKASTSTKSVFVGGGPPVLDPRDEYSPVAPLRKIKATRGPFAAYEFQDRVEVINTLSGIRILNRNGTEPVFSETGRFLVIKTPAAETYEVFDLRANRLVGRYWSVAGIFWSHADSFLYIDSSRESGLKLVRTLHGKRFDFSSIPAAEGYGIGFTSEKHLLPGPDIDPDGGGAALFVSGHENWSFDLSIERGIVAVRPQVMKVDEDNPDDPGRELIIHDLTGAHGPTRYRETPLSLATIASFHGGDLLDFKGWNAGAPFFLSAVSNVDPTYASLDEVIAAIHPVMLATQRQLSADEIVSAPKLVRRSLATRSADFKVIPTSSINILSAKLDLLKSTAIKTLRAGSSNNTRLKAIEAEIAPLYDVSKNVKFGVKTHNDAYYTDPFPDPSVVQKERLGVQLTVPGRDLWTWKVGQSTYWLTQTVQSNRNVHWFSFSILNRASDKKTRFADLTQRAAEFQKSRDSSSTDDAFKMYELGDTRTDLVSSFPPSSSLVSISGERFLAILTRPFPVILLFDLSAWKLVCAIPSPSDAADAVQIATNADGAHVTQINRDGALHVYSCKTGGQVLTGAYFDDDVIVLDRFGYFDGSAEAAGYIVAAVPGLSGRHLLSQFEGKLKFPNLAELTLRDEGPVGPPQITPPPKAEFVSTDGGSVLLKAYGSPGLQSLQVFGDGRPLVRESVNGAESALLLKPEQIVDYAHLSAIAVDTNGIVSAPVTTSGGRNPNIPFGRLLALAVGVNSFPGLQANLAYASADASRIVQAISTSKQYTSVRTKLLLEKEANQKAIVSMIDSMVAEATANDTIVVFFASHGIIDQTGALRVALTSTSRSSIEGTSLSFDEVAKSLQKAKSRVVVLLDVCHAGTSGDTMVAANDDAVRQLNTASGASMIILSASKGRQYSLESSALKGGLFSLAISDLLKRRQLSDHPQPITLDDLYRTTKSYVVRESGGAQTPWLSRNQIFGDLDLF